MMAAADSIAGNGLTAGRVDFLLDSLTHYRVAFFEHLREKAAGQGIQVNLIFGHQPDAKFLPGSIEWATPSKLYHLGKATYLPGYRKTREADLVVISQVIRQLHLYPLVLRQLSGKQKIALWGHGKIFGGGGSAGERLIKRWVSKRVHWWFAYNNLSRNVVRDEIGFPEERITSVMNSIDTSRMRAKRRDMPPEEIRSLRKALGLTGDHVCLHISGMTPNKRVPFLMEACDLIKRQIPDFEILIIGPNAYDVKSVVEASKARPWIHYLGPKSALEAVPYWALSKLLLYPGMVGLVAVDSFAMGVPLLTMNVPDHSVEIDYVQSGRNGLIITPWQDKQAFVDAAVSLLKDPVRLRELSEGALRDAGTYTVENMASRFLAGLQDALQAPALRRANA